MALHQQLDELIHRVLPVVQEFHGKAMLAPHAARLEKSGALKGSALATDGSAHLSVLQAIDHFETSFARLAQAGELTASGIFYHSSGVEMSDVGTVVLPPGSSTDDCTMLVALLEHASGDSVYLLIPYTGQPPAIQYATGKLVQKPPKVFVPREIRQPKPWWKLW